VSANRGSALRRIATVVQLVAIVLALVAAVGGRAARAEEAEPAHGGAAPAASAETEKGVGDGAEGAGEHAVSVDFKSLALQLLNFGVLLAILVKFGGGAINKALAARHDHLRAEIASAAAARAQAEARLKKQEERLAGLEREIANMRAGIKAEAEVEKAQLIAGAEERARRLREETAFVVEQQVKEAQVALRRDVAESALRVAEDTLRRSVNSDDHRRLAEGFMSDVIGSEPLVTGKEKGI
jgi:F-type H+-transporting ATPase subunit b